MTKRIVHIILISILNFAAYGGGIEFRNVSYQEALQLSITEKKPLFIDFYTTWCGPCKILASDIFTNAKLGGYINQEFIAVQIDAEKDVSAAKKYGVSAFPTIILAHPTDDINIRIVGVQPADEIYRIAVNSKNPEHTRLLEVREEYQNGKRDEQFVLEYLKLLKANNSPYKHIAKDFVESVKFNILSSISLQIMKNAELDEKHPQMIKLVESLNPKDKDQVAVFIDLSLRVYDNAFKQRKIELIKTFVNHCKSTFEKVLGTEMTTEEVIDYLTDLHRVRID